MKEVKFRADWTGKEEILKADTLTENEIKVMIASRNNEYGDCCIEGSTWSFTVCDNSGLDAKVYRGVVSSLIKKGYARVAGKAGDEIFALTESGKALFIEL
jgi:hypothetical protein